jgi:hypothetical protein
VATFNACAVGTAFGSVSDADGGATAAAATAPAEVGVVAALTATGCVAFDSFLAGADVGCSGAGADVAGGVLGAVGSGITTGTVGSLDGGGSTPLVLVDELGSVVLVCAPPLLLTVTPGATSALEDVAPDGFGSPVAVVAVAVAVEPLGDVEPAPVAVDEVEDPAVVVPAGSLDVVLLDVELAELVDDESEDVPVVSAAATPYPVATAVTSQAATAIPPYPPNFTARAARRDGEPAAGALDGEEANRGLIRGLAAVMGWLRCRRD